MSDSDCNRCGKCCLNMRQYLALQNPSTDGRISCICHLSRESFTVTVPKEAKQKMYDRSFFFRYPKACPFLSKDPDGCFSCLIYADRPVHCRTFQCREKK